jgi:branched-chain amino acid aminotransferase
MASLVWYEGRWHERPPPILSPLDHAFFMASSVFDGARAFGRCVPDLDRHCRRLVASAEAMLLRSPLAAEQIEALCRDGVRRFPPEAELYIRPMVFATRGWVEPDPDSSTFVLALQELPLPGAKGLMVGWSDARRPARDMAITEAKAGCLYPNMQRALRAARLAGFDNAVTFDANGNVAELCTANLWIVRDGEALTPAANGTFLAGITRGRVMELLNAAGIPAREATLARADLEAADELFATGNYGKVQPITRLGERDLQPGPVYARARELYLEFAATTRFG